jgi:hypothetical protein
LKVRKWKFKKATEKFVSRNAFVVIAKTGSGTGDKMLIRVRISGSETLL